jgi:hypothetical protein
VCVQCRGQRHAGEDQKQYQRESADGVHIRVRL